MPHAGTNLANVPEVMKYAASVRMTPVKEKADKGETGVAAGKGFYEYKK